MTESDVPREEIEKFVRDDLGCTCPDEVFEAISVVHDPVEFGDLQKGCLLAIGGKLLIYLVKMHDWSSLIDSLEQIFNRGREKRDAGKFNRFRLVVVTPSIQPARQILLRQFDSLSERDGRLHLHIVTPDQLPKLLSR
jgi:hypothetical protein